MDSVRCGVCSEVFEVGEHYPLVLPCGHTFCRECIHNMLKTNTLECPACRRIHNIICVSLLPKNFALLSLSVSKYMPGMCTIHGDPTRFWCLNCQEHVCGVCMFEGHPKDEHHVVQTKTLLDQKKKILGEEANRLLQLTKVETTVHETSYSRYEKKLLRLLKTNNDVCYLHDQVQRIFHEAMESTDMVTLLEAEAKFKKLQANTHKVISSSGVMCANRKFLEERDTESIKKTNDIFPIQEPAKTLCLNIRCIAGGSGRLQWDRERLLFFAAAGGPFQTSSGIQMIAVTAPLNSPENTEVFLDLSVGELSLGRVFIRLHRHLRRAQHFQALCAGTFGPTYRGSRFLAVKRRHEPEESVAGGDYLTPEGEVTARALMTDLEWGGSHAGDRREGLIVGSSGGNVDEDARFGISTSKSASGQCQCPFGEVVEGLDVVRKTLQFANVRQVTISDCGLVLNHHQL